MILRCQEEAEFGGCRNAGVKTSIAVGFIGYPNVGKSSVINSLKRARTCHVGAQPGLTRSRQEVHLDSKVQPLTTLPTRPFPTDNGLEVRLVDSPGVVLAPAGSLDPVEVALKNAIRLENVADPVAPVHAILRRCSKDTVCPFPATLSEQPFS